MREGWLQRQFSLAQREVMQSPSWMFTGTATRKKTTHRANMVGKDGSVSALCFKRPRKIDLRRSSWTIRDDAVTCPKCLRALAEVTGGE